MIVQSTLMFIIKYLTGTIVFFIGKSKNFCERKVLDFSYSEVPNKSVTFFILFWDFFLPTWPY